MLGSNPEDSYRNSDCVFFLLKIDGGFPTQQAIASMTGNSRETVTRIIKSFKDQGFLYTKGRKMVIPDFESFKRLTLDNSG